MITFIVPCFNEQDNVEAFYTTFDQTFSAEPALEWRLVMVDDGSSDNTYSYLEKIALHDKRVTVLRFSRNFGKEAAIYAGLEQAQDSEFVGIIDADLQQSPTDARAMYEMLVKDADCDCVAAVQEERHEGAFMNFTKNTFYSVFARASRSSDVIANASDFRVFRQRVCKAILELPEYYRFSKGIFSWVGFKTAVYPYTPSERKSGTTKWSLSSLVSYALEGILSFSTRPLHMVTILGTTASVLALIYAIVLIIKTLAFGVDVPGYASTIALILLFGGAQLLAIGVIGEYLARMYVQEKHRPIYILKDSINSGDHDQ